MDGIVNEMWLSRVLLFDLDCIVLPHSNRMLLSETPQEVVVVLTPPVLM